MESRPRENWRCSVAMDAVAVNQRKSASLVQSAALTFKKPTQGLEARSLNKKLAFNLNAAPVHEGNGLPRGHKAYASLFDEAEVLLAEFAENDLLAGTQTGDQQAPAGAIQKLRSWYPVMNVNATPPGTTAPNKTKIAGMLVVRLIILGPVVTAFMYGTFHRILKLMRAA